MFCSKRWETEETQGKWATEKTEETLQQQNQGNENIME